jgi:hypothetical protein
MWFAVGSRVLPVSRSFGAAERRKSGSGYNFIEMSKASRAVAKQKPRPRGRPGF